MRLQTRQHRSGYPTLPHLQLLQLPLVGAGPQMSNFVLTVMAYITSFKL